MFHVKHCVVTTHMNNYSYVHVVTTHFFLKNLKKSIVVFKNSDII